MMHRRYGRFRMRDYSSAWFGVAVMIAPVIAGLLMDMQFYLLIWPLMLSVIMVWSIWEPNRERFSISGDKITVNKGRKCKEIRIPSELSLVVSYADVCPTFSKHISHGGKTYMLKGRCAVSVLQKMPFETILECLHLNYARRYTNTTVETVFDGYHCIYNCIYSFVCDQNLLDQLLVNRDCELIIPESLREKISVDLSNVKVYIDMGY